MGEARARALAAWTGSSVFDGTVPPEKYLRRWRQAHPKGRGFSCYQRTVRVSMREIVKTLTKRVLPARVAKGLGARFVGQEGD